MQSFIQHCKIGLAVRKQVERAFEGAGLQTDRLHCVPEHPVQARIHHNISNALRTVPHADHSVTKLEQTGSMATVKRQLSLRIALGQALSGIHVRERTALEGDGGKVFVVLWDGENDPFNPRNWSIAYRVWITLLVGSIAFVVGAAASADTAVLPQAASTFGVSDEVESLAIGMFLSVIRISEN
jgi:hypothetical protein